MQAAAGSELSSLKGKSEEKDIFLKFHVSTNRSVYQQGVVEANEKNYLIRAIHRQRQGPRVSVSSSGKAIHQSLSLSFLPSKESTDSVPQTEKCPRRWTAGNKRFPGYSRIRIGNKNMLRHFSACERAKD